MPLIFLIAREIDILIAIIHYWHLILMLNCWTWLYLLVKNPTRCQNLMTWKNTNPNSDALSPWLDKWKIPAATTFMCRRYHPYAAPYAAAKRGRRFTGEAEAKRPLLEHWWRPKSRRCLTANGDSQGLSFSYVAAAPKGSLLQCEKRPQGVASPHKTATMPLCSAALLWPVT
jgi:hypothetical protein